MMLSLYVLLACTILNSGSAEHIKKVSKAEIEVIMKSLIYLLGLTKELSTNYCKLLCFHLISVVTNNTVLNPACIYLFSV